MTGGLNPIRQRAQQALEGCTGAFLRCDRGEGLYVTNAPMRGQNPQALCEALQRAGFAVQTQGALWRLTPREELVEALAAWLEGEKEAIYLPDWRGRASAQEDFSLLLEAIKRLEMSSDRAALADYEKRLRQRAACCLRTGEGGGVLSLCSRMLSRIERECAQ